MALRDLLPDDDDDWFGEGSAFDSGEDLAAALLAMAGAAAAPAAMAAPAPANGHPATARTAAVAQSLTWTVRRPGSVSMPMRQPGRTGWSIRSSVQVLHRTEDVMRQLREEAVVAAFKHAARAIRLAEVPD